MLALLSGCYCFACALFLHAFALLLTGAATWLSIHTERGDRQNFGDNQNSWQESRLLTYAMGADINIDLLFRFVITF